MIERTELPFESHFVQIPNAWLRDKRLTRKARGLLAELLTHRVGWIVTVEALAEGGPEGRDAIMSALAELEGAGYLQRERERDEGGRLRGARYTITEPPMSDLPTEGEPTEANPDPKKTTLQNTNLSKPATQSSAQTAQTLVGEWIDNCPNRPPGRVIGHVAKEIGVMLDEGIDYDMVRRGMMLWHSKGLHPSALASAVQEVLNPPSAPRGRPTPAQRFAATASIAADLFPKELAQ